MSSDPASASYLSDTSKYGYDFVVSTTQASINSGLLEYLDSDSLPEMYICYHADANANIVGEISLDDVKEQSGYSPFDIPDGTDYDDPRITALTTKAKFIVGIRMKLGLPPDILPKDLPKPVVEFGSSINDITFHMFLRECDVIQNSPASGFGGAGQWQVWSQPRDEAWYVETEVSLVQKELDKSLDTPYLNENPAIQQQLRDQLENLSGTTFSLSQLLFDLATAKAKTVPSFGGVGEKAQTVLNESYIKFYADDTAGIPLVAVTATAEPADGGSLTVTSLERQLTLNDSDSRVSTLVFLCATDGHTQPATMPFTWNWVAPADVDSESGVMAINRNTFAEYLKDHLMEMVRPACMSVDKLTVNALWNGVNPEFYYNCSIVAGYSPQTATVFTDASDSKAIHLEFSSEKLDSAHLALYYSKLWVKSNYTCDVSFEGTNTIHIVQRAVIWAEVLVDSSGTDGNIADYTLEETYSLSVDQAGNLQLVPESSKQTNNSVDPSVNGFIDYFTSINEVFDKLEDTFSGFAADELQQVSFKPMRNFVFPGAQVFTFHQPRFSNYGDLLCDITYVKPSTQAAPARKALTSSQDVSHQLSASCELMQNYVAGSLVSPTGKFTALQTQAGLSLVFALDTAGVLHVFEEQSGTTHTGWQLRDLSTKTLQNAFPNQANVVVRDFDVAQSAMDGSIGLMMAATVNGTDQLFVSLLNSSSDSSWTSSPIWSPIPFDAESSSSDNTSSSLIITGMLFAEVFSEKQYIIVDTERVSGDAATKDITRYVVHPTADEGSRWIKADIPVDVEETRYQSCVGRIHGERIDGVYTSGQAGESSQLVYVPLENVYGDGPPEPTRLSLPSDMHPTAIAVARDADVDSDQFGGTELYAVSGATLYLYDTAAQQQGLAPAALVTNDFLSGTDTLFAMMHDGVTTLWGKNGNDVVYYLTCPNTQLSVPGAWSAPVPLLTGIERLSPYVNLADGGRTVFAAGGGAIQKIVQKPSTAGSIWRPQRITLAATAPTEPALSFNSYTTTVQVVGTDKMPAREVSLAISAETSTPAYINGLYYVLGDTPVIVKTDAMGTVTVIEATEDLQGTPLTVKVVDDSSTTPLVVRPLDTAWKKLSQLNSTENLRAAKVPTEIVAGGVLGSTETTSLVDSAAEESDVQATAAAMDQLGTTWSSIQSGDTRALVKNRGVVPATYYQGRPGNNGRGLFDWIGMAAGDLFRWLETGVEAIVEVIKDAATEAWHFVAHIAGEVYAAVLDTVEAIVGAVKWLFNAIKTAIEAIIRFVQFLFEWDDIRRTKNILHNIVTLFTRDQISQLSQIKADFNSSVSAVEQSVNSWAGIEDWSKLGDPASETAAGSSANPAEGQTSGSQLLSSHFRNHASDLSIVGDAPSASVTEDLVTKLLDALSAEGEVLGDFYSRLKTLATDFSSLSIEEVLRRLAGIFVDGVLSSAQVVVDALIDFIQSFADEAMALLDTKLHIPVISEILNLLGVPDISFLDIFMWIGAVAYTVVYKVINNEPPFPDDDNSAALIGASSWDELEQLFSSTVTSPRALSQTTQQSIYVSANAMSGMVLFIGNIALFMEAQAPTAGNTLSGLVAVIKLIVVASVGASNLLAPKDPIQDSGMKVLSRVCFGLDIATSFLGFTPVYGKLAATTSKFPDLLPSDGRAVGAVFKALLLIPKLMATSYHLYELTSEEAGAARSAAIVGEVANLTGAVVTVSYAAAVNDKELASRQVPIGVMTLCVDLWSGLLVAESMIH
ncbi:hypothetical protein AtubIFM55763_004296 [Aspergillus tubingensis]|uniref:uncharacterized protein n=1 Tax=Aspergillus tubingensis TaxID=5068 RepID=UPI00157A1112|nr:glyoxalase 3 [Aspergillus tubingensis]GFN17260.1 glyoxalase 3 [Aspergillus tubingensis]GLA73383.1 hypothetical protein AtubIFM55763_004296 [Aspergillus tubingensis]